MQNNEHSESNRFRKFFQEKGYYIVLLLCILAVGISGYIFVSGAVSEKKALNEQTLSVATSAEIPEDKPSSSSSGGKTQSDGSTQTQKPAEEEVLRIFVRAVEVEHQRHAEQDNKVRDKCCDLPVHKLLSFRLSV